MDSESERDGNNQKLKKGVDIGKLNKTSPNHCCGIGQFIKGIMNK